MARSIPVFLASPPVASGNLDRVIQTLPSAEQTDRVTAQVGFVRMVSGELVQGASNPPPAGDTVSDPILLRDLQTGTTYYVWTTGTELVFSTVPPPGTPTPGVSVPNRVVFTGG